MRVCDGLSCELAGAQDLLARLPALLGERRARDRGALHRPLRAGAGGGGGPDAVPLPSRRGRRGGAGKLPPSAAPRRRDFEPARWPSTASRAARRDAAPAFVDYAAYRADGGYALAAALVAGARDAESVIKAMEDSGLRGLGGAGFPAGRKWRIVREQPAPRLMAVNIDEGEPGTFKDRTYLERDPHRFLEGLLVAAQVVGIERLLHLPARRVPRLPRAARGRAGQAAGRSALRAAARSSCGAAPAPTSAAKSPR